MPGMPPNMGAGMLPPSMSPGSMPSPPAAHLSPPHLTHLPDGHMMPHQQPMGGLHGGPHQMAVQQQHQQHQQQQGMAPLGGHRPPGMGSPPGPLGSPMHMGSQVSALVVLLVLKGLVL